MRGILLLKADKGKEASAAIGAKGRIAMHNIEHKPAQEAPTSTPVVAAYTPQIELDFQLRIHRPQHKNWWWIPPEKARTLVLYCTYPDHTAKTQREKDLRSDAKKYYRILPRARHYHLSVTR